MKFERLGEKITQVRGISYKPNDISAIPMPDYVPILKANNIQEEGIDTSDLIYIHKSKVKSEQFIKEGDLLLAASSGSKEIVGKNIYFESDFNGSFGAFCKLVRPKKNINPRYLAAFFKSVPYKRHIRKLLSGALINNLKNEYIDSLLIPDISDSAQLHIANLLSKAENLIAQRKESIRLLDEFLKSTFLEMFGDLENDTPLKSFCFFSQGIQVPVEEQYSECKDGQVRFLRIIDFTQSDEPRYINNLGERYFVSEDDISMVRYGASAGFVGYGKKGIIANNLFKFNFDKKKVLPVYLVQVLQSQRFKIYIKLKSTGSAMPALSFGMLNDYKIAVPPIELQTQFARIVEKTEALKTQYKQSLQELENLYGSLSQRAFRGELMV
jgi:type I restriction enzyme S subunit